MTTHCVKIESVYYERILEGSKTFEIRFDDRGYQKGDTIILMECLPPCTKYDLTGREVSATVGYCTSYGQKDNYVVFSILDIKVRKTIK